MSVSCRILGIRLLPLVFRGRAAPSALPSRRGLFQGADDCSNREEYPPLPRYQEGCPAAEEMAVVKVRGLPWTCTMEDLVGFFYDCKIRNGEEGIHLPLNREGKPRGDAIIEFETEEDVQKALEKHKKYLGQRYLEVYKVNPQDAALLLNRLPQAISQTVDEGVVRLRGLPYSCTEEDIFHFFTGLPIAEDGITFVLDHRGQKSGEAFVQFASKEAAEQALLKHKEEIGNRYIEIFKSRRSEIQSLRFPFKNRRKDTTFSATDKDDHGQSAVSDNQLAQDVASFSDHVNGEQSTVEEYFQEMPEKPLDIPAFGDISYVPTIHMRGLPFQASAEDIANFFHPLTPLRITMEYNSFGKATGEAMVQFASQEDAVCAMVKNRSLIQKRYVELLLNASPKRQ